MMRVVIAGGGIAALEVLAGLRALAVERVQATLLAPEPAFSYRPLSTATPFTFRAERTRPLGELTAGLGAGFVRDGLAHVDEERARILTQNGDLVPFDALVVAIGARSAAPAGGIPIWQRRADATARFGRLLRELEDGTARSAAFVVPSRAAWPVDAYELALVAALAAGSEAKLFLVTAEVTPLEAFGAAAGDAVADELGRAGIELVTGVEALSRDAREDRSRDAFSSMVARVSRRERGSGDRDRVVLRLEPGSPLAVDRALALPSVHGPAIAGMTNDDRGFVPVDAHARVVGSHRLFAAGDATSLALKHSALASSQATAAAEAIAAEAGADVDPAPWAPVLHGVLTVPPHFPGRPGSPWLDDGEPVTHCLWWPPGHAAGRHLAPYLAAADPGVRPGLDWHPGGVPLAVPVGREAHARAARATAVPSEEAVRHDVITRQLMAVRRAQREGTRLAHELERRRAEFDAHEREVVAQLRAAGYLTERAPK